MNLKCIKKKSEYEEILPHPMSTTEVNKEFYIIPTHNYCGTCPGNTISKSRIAITINTL